MSIRLTLLILSFLILGAHFLRDDNYVIMILCLLAPLLLFIKRQRILIVIQILLYCGVLVWINTIIQLVSERMDLEQPLIRMAIILSVVSLITGVSGLLLNSKVIKKNIRANYNVSIPTSEGTPLPSPKEFLFYRNHFLAEVVIL